MNRLSKYKYLLGSVFLIFMLVCICSAINKKETLYVFFDDYSSCSNIEEYQKKEYKYYVCYNGKNLFFKLDTSRKAKNVKSILKLNIKSKDFLFKNTNVFRNKKLFLVLKLQEGYRLLPVNSVKFIS